jgi:hypothetical protein
MPSPVVAYLHRITRSPLRHARTRERATGIEPAFSAWEADVLPLNYAREQRGGYQAAWTKGPANRPRARVVSPS